MVLAVSFAATDIRNYGDYRLALELSEGDGGALPVVDSVVFPVSR
jgi:hypothetical protein